MFGSSSGDGLAPARFARPVPDLPQHPKRRSELLPVTVLVPMSLSLPLASPSLEVALKLLSLSLHLASPSLEVAFKLLPQPPSLSPLLLAALFPPFVGLP